MNSFKFILQLSNDCETFFGTKCFYHILAADETSTMAEIKRAYKRMSLKVHPDRASNDGHATRKFQVLQHVYEVLSSENMRALYDRCYCPVFDTLFFQAPNIKSASFFKKDSQSSDDSGVEEELDENLQKNKIFKLQFSFQLECSVFKPSPPPLLKKLMDSIQSALEKIRKSNNLNDDIFFKPQPTAKDWEKLIASLCKLDSTLSYKKLEKLYDEILDDFYYIEREYNKSSK